MPYNGADMIVHWESELSTVTPRLFKLFDELTTLSPMSSSLMVTFDLLRTLQTTINSVFEGFNFSLLFVVQVWMQFIPWLKSRAAFC